MPDNLSWIQDIKDELEVKTVPDYAKTAKEIAQEIGHSLANTQKLLLKKFEEGVLDRGKQQNTFYYWEKKDS